MPPLYRARVAAVGDETDMRRLCRLRCEAIITNYPDIARRVADEAR